MINLFYIDVDQKIKLKLLVKEKNEFYELINRNREHLYSFMPRIKENKSIEDTEIVIKVFLEQLYQNNGFRTGIFFEGKLVGIIGLKYIDWINSKTEIMYWIDKDYLAKGITTKCTMKVLELAFNYYNLNKVILKASLYNKASIRVAEKCGFNLEGISREDELLITGFTDVCVYSILRNEYRSMIK